jgi:transposase-like protein
MSRSKKQYSDEFKDQALAKVYSRGNRSIQAIADELNLSIHTLKTWMSHTPSTDNRPAQSKPAQRPQDWRPEQRLQALQESHSLSGEALNAWCREHGVFAHQLAQWKSEFCTATRSGSSREESQNLRSLKAENQRLERELQRKDKALAEAAALLILQKKVRALLGGEVE